MSGALPALAPPDWSSGVYLGADGLGRDLATKLLAAGGNMAGPLGWALALPLALGVGLGVWAGMGAGWARWLVGSLIDLVESLPKLILALAAIWVIDVDARWLSKLYPLIGLTFTPMIFYAVRERTRRVVSEGFIEAQRALGSSPWRIVGVHVLWNNCRGAVAVQAAQLLGYLLMFDLTLGYLGYSQPDEDLITWGRLVYVGLREAPTPDGAWNPWVRLAPLGLVALFTVTAAVWADAWQGRRDR